MVARSLYERNHNLHSIVDFVIQIIFGCLQRGSSGLLFREGPRITGAAAAARIGGDQFLVLAWFSFTAAEPFWHELSAA
jgi:hypothetical protein